MAAKKQPVKEREGKGKTQPLSIRVDPQIKYGLELLSRAQHRPITGVVEWCILEGFRREKIRDFSGEEKTVEHVLGELAAAGELERLLITGFIYPTLLSFEERRIYRVLLETPQFWKDQGHTHTLNSFLINIVLPHWEKLKPMLDEVASGLRTTHPLSEGELRRAGLSALCI
jgi:hypothetical protein